MDSDIRNEIAGYLREHVAEQLRPAVERGEIAVRSVKLGVERPFMVTAEFKRPGLDYWCGRMDILRPEPDYRWAAYFFVSEVVEPTDYSRAVKDADGTWWIVGIPPRLPAECELLEGELLLGSWTATN